MSGANEIGWTAKGHTAWTARWKARQEAPAPQTPARDDTHGNDDTGEAPADQG